jgi:hypothetical protein
MARQALICAATEWAAQIWLGAAFFFASFRLEGLLALWKGVHGADVT